MVRLNVLIVSEYAAFCLAENPPFAPIDLYHKANMRNFAADFSLLVFRFIGLFSIRFNIG